MKKIISCLLTAALSITAVPMLELGTTAYALTMVSDAKTAVEKNAAAFSDYIEKAEITNDITREDLENMIFECCEYTATKATEQLMRFPATGSSKQRNQRKARLKRQL